MRKKQNVVPAPEPAPWNRRGFAYVLDGYLGSAFSAIPVGLLWNMLTGEDVINTDLTQFQVPYGYLAGLLGLVFGAIYFFVIPMWVWKGQTLGKRLMNIRIIGEDNNPLPAGRLAVRQLFGVMVFEAAFLLTGQYAVQMLTMLSFGVTKRALSYLLFGVFLVSCWLAYRDGKAAHDIWAKSKVADGKE